MSGISIGEVEATLRLRDQATPTLSKIADAQQRLFVAQAQQAQEAATKVKAAMEASAKAAETAAQRAADETKRAAAEMRQAWDTVGAGLTQVGTRMTALVTVPIAAMFVGSAKAAMDFESAMANVRKTVGSAAVDHAGLDQKIRDLAKTIPKTTEELAGIAAMAGQMGVRAPDIAKFTMHVAALSVAVDGISGEEAAMGLAQIGNVAGTGTRDIANMASSLVALGNSSNSTEGEILEFTKRLIGAGNQIGLTVSETMALGTSMADLGINAEAGGTAMSRIMNDMAKAVETGSEKVDVFAKVAGKSGQEFAATFKGDPMTAIRGFVDGLAKMQANGENVYAVFQDMDQEGVRVTDVLLRMAGAGDSLNKALDTSSAGWSSQNAHLAEAKEKYGTTANQLKLLWNNVKDVGITLGNILLPAINDTVKAAMPFIAALADMAKGFAGLPEPVRIFAMGILGLAAVGGPLMMLVGSLISAGGQIALFSRALTTISTVSTVSQIGNVAGAVGGLAAVFLRYPWLLSLLKGGGLVGLGAGAGLLLQNAMGSDGKAGGPQGLNVDSGRSRKVGTDINLLAPVEELMNAGMMAQSIATVMTGATAAVDKGKQAMRDAAQVAKQYGEDLKKLGTNGMQAVINMHKQGGEELGKLAARYGVHESSLIQFMGKQQAAVKETTELQKTEAKSYETYLERIAKIADDHWENILKETKAAKQKVAQEQQELWVDSLKHYTTPSQMSNMDWQNLDPYAFDRRGVDQRSRQGQWAEQDKFISTLDTSNMEDPRKSKRPGAFSGFGAGFGNDMSAMMGQMPQVVLGAMMGGGDIGKSVGGLLGGGLTEQLGKSVGTALSGVLGKTLGSALGSFIPGLGTMLGGALGGVVGNLFGPSQAKQTDTARKDWMASVDVDALKGQAAEAGISLDAIFNAKKVKDFEAAVKAVSKEMEAYAKKQKNAAEFAAVFQQVLGDVATSGRLASKEVLDMMEKVKGTAAGGAAISAFVQGQAQVAITGITGYLSVASAAFKEVGDKQEELGVLTAELAQIDKKAGASQKETLNDIAKKELDLADLKTRLAKATGSEREKIILTIRDKEIDLGKLQAKLGGEDSERRQAIVDKIKAINIEIDKQKGIIAATAITSQETADAFSAGLLGSFALLIEKGASVTEAIKAIAPAITSLDDQMKKAGLTGNAAFTLIRDMVSMAADKIAGPAIEAVNSLGQGLVGLHNAGLLNQQTFVGLTNQITQTFQSLVKQGFSGDVAMRLMQPTLQTIWEMMTDFGFEVDAATLALINQGKAAGIVGDQHRDADDRIARGLQTLIDLLSDFLEIMAKDIPKAAADAADAIGAIADSVPDNPFANWQMPGWTVPTGPDSSGHTPDYGDWDPSNGDSYGDHGPVDWNNPNLKGWLIRNPGDHERAKQIWAREGWRGFAVGTPGLAPVDFGAGTPVELHGREAIVPENRMADAARAWGGDDGVREEIAALRQDLITFVRDQPRAIRIAISDGGAYAPRKRG